MHKAVMVVGAGLVGLALGAAGATYVSAQPKPPEIKRTELLRQPLSGMPDREFVVFLADIPPGGVASKHYHPGDEAIYMLQGALKFTPADGQPFTLKAGEIAFNPAKHVHQAVNASATEPAKVLNCMIAEKGQPLATPVK